jgi:two-component system copper resistance phosphate regulon response regulator CusR
MRVLLVEDEEKVVRFVARGLKAERYAVDVAMDGPCGLDHVRAYDYDLILLDLNLPGFSGTELLKLIRKRHPHVPVLILTAKDSITDKVKNFEEGADDYLTKPFSFAELLVRVKALLRRGPVTSSTSLRVGELELDRVVHKVKRGEAQIELTSKEFSLLEYLMLNAGRVLSRTMIVEHVWDQSFEGLTNIVDVYVRQLRKKIDDGHERKLFRTVRGVGYSITEDGS